MTDMKNHRPKVYFTFNFYLMIPLIAIVFGTSSRADETPAEGDMAPEFHPRVATVIYGKCSQCHRPGQAAPFPLLSYGDVYKRGRQIRDVVESEYMPPWNAASRDLQFHGDRRLSPEEKATLIEWIDAGMPEGDETRAPSPPEFADEWFAGTPDMVVSMPEAFEVYAEGRDIYRNFAMPLNNDRTLYLKAIEIRPSSRAVVHHVLYFVDATGASIAKDREDPLPGFDGMGFTSRLRGIGGWAVGGVPVPLPDGMAHELPPNSTIVLQTHFHPTGKVERESTTLGLYLSQDPPTRDFTGIQLPPRFGALAGVDIPAGEADYTVHDSFTLPCAIEAFGVSAHAHYLGKVLRMDAELPDGRSIELLRIDEWDFNWQEGYLFAEPLQLPAGTRISAMVSWDNSAANPANPHNPPRRVRWGPYSYDEMGSLTLRVSPIDGKEISTLRAALADHQTYAVATQILKRASTRDSDRLNFFQKRILQFDVNGNGLFDPDEKDELMSAIRRMNLRLGERLNNSF